MQQLLLGFTRNSSNDRSFSRMQTPIWLEQELDTLQMNSGSVLTYCVLSRIRSPRLWRDSKHTTQSRNIRIWGLPIECSGSLSSSERVTFPQHLYDLASQLVEDQTIALV